MCKLSYQKRKKKDINNELKKKKFLDNIAPSNGGACVA
jgi:hypothetical protein